MSKVRLTALSAVSFGQGPSPGLQACTGWDTCPSLALLIYKKTNIWHGGYKDPRQDDHVWTWIDYNC